MDYQQQTKRQIKVVIEKRFGQDELVSHYGYLSLAVEAVSDQENELGLCKKSHDSGWTIEAVVKEDYFRYVDEFSAVHPVYGRVWGEFREVVYADSKESFEHFFEHHPPKDWNLGDI